ncbi:MAG: hypothetical protein K2X01_05420 [Cyanobacteria bacterium]|nr:hypothetical protein [Cyanobacteriota bacterium]
MFEIQRPKINLAGTPFEGPEPLVTFKAPDRGGVFAILSVNEADYFVIYLGETPNLMAHGIHASHPKYSCWKNFTGVDAKIYVATFLEESSIRRNQMLKSLLAEFTPLCNTD